MKWDHTHLDAIKGRYATLRGLPRSDMEWLLAQVEALAGALGQIDDIAAAHYRGAIGDAQYVARNALAALEEKG